MVCPIRTSLASHRLNGCKRVTVDRRETTDRRKAGDGPRFLFCWGIEEETLTPPIEWMQQCIQSKFHSVAEVDSPARKWINSSLHNSSWICGKRNRSNRPFTFLSVVNKFIEHKGIHLGVIRWCRPPSILTFFSTSKSLFCWRNPTKRPILREETGTELKSSGF